MLLEIASYVYQFLPGKTSVVIGSVLKLVPTVAVTVCYFISMCFLLILVHLQFVACMSAMLDVFVVRYQCLPKSDLGRIWHYADDTYRLV